MSTRDTGGHPDTFTSALADVLRFIAARQGLTRPVDIVKLRKGGKPRAAQHG